MPRMTPESRLHVLATMGIDALKKGPSLALGAVISNRIRALLRHVDVDGWRLNEADVVCINPVINCESTLVELDSHHSAV